MLKRIIQLSLFILSSHLVSAQNATPVSLFIKDTKGECYQEFYVPVQVKDFKNVTKLLFSLAYDPVAFSWQGIKLVNLGNVNSVTLNTPGKVSYSWNGNSTNLKDNDTLFVIALTPIEKGGYTTDIKFTSDPTQIVSIPTNLATQNGKISIIDNTPPNIICPKTVFIDTVNVATTVVGITPMITDTCDNNTVYTKKYVLTGATSATGVGDANGKLFNVGTTNGIYTASDKSGNEAVCPFQVIINPKTPDIFLFAQSTRVSCEADEIVLDVFAKNIVKLGSIDFSFNWDALVGTYKSIDLSNSPASMTLNVGNFNNVGNAVGFSWVANPVTDPSGITLKNGKSVLLFKIKLKSSKLIGLNYGLNFSNTPTVFDASIITATSPNITQKPVNIIPIASVLMIEDNKKPSLTCPKDLFLMETTNVGTMVVNDIAPVVLDNCGLQDVTYSAFKENNTILKNGITDASGSSFPLGANKVTYFAIDKAGNTSTCSFTVKIARFELTAKSDTVDCKGKKAKINILVKDFSKIKRIKFDLIWTNTSNVIFTNSNTLISATNSTLTNTVDFSPNNGVYKVEFSSTNANGTTLPDGTSLVTVELDLANTVIGTSYNLNIANEVVDYAGPPVVNNLPKKLNNGGIFVLDKEGPVFTKGCGNDVVINILSDNCDTTYTWNAMVMKNIDVIDPCSAVVAVTVNITPGSVFSTGITKVNYNAIDQYGNLSTCGFNVTVKDAKKPTVKTNDSKTYYIQPDSCDISIKDLPLLTDVAFDNCGMDSVKVSVKNGSKFPIGVTNVTYTAYDKSGNFAIYTRKVTVLDTITPKIGVTANTILQITDTTKCTVPAIYQLPTVKDNCPTNLTLVPNIKVGDPLSAGTNIITFLATDASGNTSTKTLQIIVIDNAAPVFQNPPANVTFSADPGLCGKTINYQLPNAIDNCSGTNVTVIVNTALSDLPANNFFEAGKSYTIVFQADDQSPASPSKYYAWKITIKLDSESPKIVCPSGAIIPAANNSCGVNVNVLPAPISISDNCSAASNIVVAASNFTYGYKSIGQYLVNYQATDEAGNTALCSFVVEIKDTTKPKFLTMPQSVTANTDLDKCTTKVTWDEPTFTDNCSKDSLKVTKTPNVISPSTFLTGVNKIVYKIQDKAGNVAFDTLKITILDKQAPTPLKPCGETINLVASKDSCGVVWNNGIALFTDNCSSIKVAINTTVVDDFYPVGSLTVVTFTAVDAAGNMTNCTKKISITEKVKPTHTSCPSDIAIVVSKGKCDTIIDITKLGKPVFSDNCDKSLDVSFTTIPSSITTATGNKISENTSVIWVAVDDSGNADTCIYKIIVIANNKPKLVCPSDVTVIPNKGECTQVATFGLPQITLGCSALKDTTVTFASGTKFPTGANIIGYSVSDLYGNIAVCTFKVIVKDTIKPVFDLTNVNLPKDVSLKATTNCKAKYTWNEPIPVKDNCDASVVAVNSSSFKPGDDFPIGKTKVTYTAVDKSGNSATYSFNITVTSDAKPTFKGCPSGTIQYYVNGQKKDDPTQFIQNYTPINGCNGVNLSYDFPKANTDCSSVKVTANATNPSNASKFVIGKNPMSFEAVDTFGNKTTCAFTIEVLPIPTPKVSLKDTTICGNASIDLSVTGALPGATYTWVGPNNYTKTGSNISLSVPTNPLGIYTVSQVTNEGCVSKSDSTKINQTTAPTGANDKAEVISGKTLNDKVTTNDAIPTGVKYTTTLKSDVKPEAGKLTLNPDGTYTFVSKAGYIGIATFTYELCYTACGNKCSQPLIVQIEVKSDNSVCEIPTVITPNGDNLNDVLVIDCAIGKTDNELTVFNRWGEPVFNSKPYDPINKPWDAFYKNEVLPDGTYFYIYKDSATAEAKKGYITVFR